MQIVGYINTNSQTLLLVPLLRCKHVSRPVKMNALACDVLTKNISFCNNLQIRSFTPQSVLRKSHSPFHTYIPFSVVYSVLFQFPVSWLLLNPLTPNGHYSGRTASLTSKRCILYIYSTNIFTEYFKHGIYSPYFSLQNAVCFIILKYFVPVLFTFYIQGVLKLKN